MEWINHNGKMLPAEAAILPAQNRSFKYGDGVFETMRFVNGALQLAAYHFERLFSSLVILEIDTEANFTEANLTDNIQKICAANQCLSLSRVRLAVYRDEENKAGYVLETFALKPDILHWNDHGWRIDLFPDARKSCDGFATLKTANYLPYIMADRFAHQKGLDECVVLNSYNHLCDASKANIFLVMKNELVTPALHQGCINGVMRRYVLEEAKKKGIAIQQQVVTEAHLFEADEVFLTNAIQGIRWVKNFRTKEYTNRFTKDLYHSLFPVKK